MSMLADLDRQVTYRVELPGGQSRLKEASLYVMRMAASFDFFGLVKLNKILWRADFEAFKERHSPVTGRLYVKLKAGPAPYEMLPLLNEMKQAGLIEIAETKVPNEQRPVAIVDPVLKNFSPNDLRFLDDAIAYYRDMTAAEASEDSHGLAWKTRDLGEPIPYDAVIFDDRYTNENLPPKLEDRFHEIAHARRLHSA
jgi:hypothetical protein